MMRTMARAGLLLLVGSLVVPACTTTSTEGGVSEALKAYVETAEVVVSPLERTLELTGTVEAGRAADLVPDMPGRVRRLDVHVGDRVKQGQVLAELDTDLVDLQMRQAEAGVKLATLQLEAAKREFARAEGLYRSGSMPKQQFEQAQTGLEMAKLQLAQARAAQALAKRQQAGGKVVAPFDGVVTWVACEEDENFNPMSMSIGKPPGLVSIVDMHTIRIDLQVSDTDVAHIEEGMPARIFVDVLADRLPPQGVEGRVEYVGKAADPASRTFPVRVQAENPDETILVGMHARVRLVLERRDRAIQIPASALLGEEGDRYVMVVEGGRVRKVPVRTGLEGDSGVEVLEGLKGGESVVVEGGFGLVDGALVEVAK